MAPDAPKPTQESLKDEVRDMAKKVFAAGINMLVIDTENKFVSTGFAEEIAKAAQGVQRRLLRPAAAFAPLVAASDDALPPFSNVGVHFYLPTDCL